MKKTLKKFLEKNRACTGGFDFAKDLTLEEFLTTCQRGDWILWLFAKMNPESLRELTLAKGHCANTVREFMKDERSTRAVDVAIAFGEGKATREELDDAAADAASDAASAASDASDAVDAVDAAWASANAASAAYAAASAAYVAYAAASDAADAASAAYAAASAAYAAASDAADASDAASAAYANAKKQNQKLTADICRKYLPLEIWNQNLI